MSFLKNRTVVGVICILLSLLICFGLTPLFNQSVSQKAEIVRVVQPIRAGDEITESMVQIVEVGGYNLPEDVLRQKESAVGKYATADLAVGDYLPGGRSGVRAFPRERVGRRPCVGESGQEQPGHPQTPGLPHHAGDAQGRE